MLQRTGRAIRLLLAAFAIAAAAAPERDPAPRIVAVGDLHGDWEGYRAILRDAGLIDSRDRWAGGRTILVQTGDIVDRGPDSLKIVRDLMRLRRQAERAGGRVVTLVGNHEAMNVTGDLRYVDPGEYAAFVDDRSEERRERVYRANRTRIGEMYRARSPDLAEEEVRAAWIAETPLGWAEHRAAWHPEGELGRWAISSPAVALIDGTLFVHGGISSAYAHLPPDEINRRVAAALAAMETEPESIVNDPHGPLWYRGLAEGGEAAGAEVEAVLQALGARRIVVGHTPARGPIQFLHGGRLVRIDTGIAPAYRGRRTWLEIAGGEARGHVVEDGR